jgi:hypothetical protein
MTWFSAPAPVARRVRGYFAPVNRSAQAPVLFDPSEQGGFCLNTPPSPWIDLGWIQEFTRKAGSRTAAVLTGIPAGTLEQVRETLEAQVSFCGRRWRASSSRCYSSKRIDGDIYCFGRSGCRKVHG